MLVLLCAASCKKENKNEDQLPPATQTGANTFGCLVNGKVFVPRGYDGTGRPNPHVQYEYDLNGQPYLIIEARQYTSNQITGNIRIGFGNLNTLGYYPVSDSFNFSVGWIQVIPNCGMGTSDPSVHVWGGGVITKLDNSNDIISGTFEFKAIKPGCDTVRVTDGRFDIKF